MVTRVAVVTQDDPFYMPEFFRSFLSTLSKDISIREVTLLDAFDEPLHSLVSRMLRLYGPRNFVVRGLQYVSRTALDTLGRGQYSVTSIAADHGIPFEHRESVNDPAYVEWVENEEIDIVLSVSAPQIFDEPLLEAPTWGCINVHAGKLPDYRGMFPTFWALFKDESEFGVTVHTMTPKIDRGQRVKESVRPIHPDDSLDDVIIRGKRTGGKLAADVLDEIERGTASLTPIGGDGTYYSFPTLEERREFQKRGNHLL